MAARAIGRLTRICVALGLSLLAGAASAQTYGFATLPPGSLSHVISSAIAKVLKEKAGLNVLVQPTAGGDPGTDRSGRYLGRDAGRRR